ncbi:c-type cytochrome [Parasediminibacterium sp. JCM 36343]|uniref:c-type cytochrome n=1 Tax=Parasediminibacterium sp. JCM 36343 TaxID=3374279 RepID=UPI00397C71D1
MKKMLLVAIICSATVYVWAQTQKPAKKSIAQSPAASAQRGAGVYKTECLSCHQADGGGVPHLNPPLYENTDVVGDKKKIISIVLKGMTDRIPIDGEYYGNNMASHANLTNQQIADVLTYIRASFGNKASAVTAEDVKAVRGGKKA